MNWRLNLIRHYSGHPLRVALNLLAIGFVGIVTGHWLFDIPLSDRLVMGAMIPGLVAIVIAAILKEKHGRHRPG